jgi:uncharacterized protein (TIGR04255 family)
MNWRPIHEGHSISEMALTFELDRLLSAEDLERVAASKGSFPGLPGVNIGRGFPIPRPMVPMIPSPSQLPIMAVAFDRFTQAGLIAERLAAQGNALGYVTTEYTRWQSVSDSAFSYLTTLAALVPDVVAVGVVLRYVDKFIWGQAPDGHDASYLLREGSKYLAPTLLTVRGLGHSHTGFYQRLPGGAALVNVNVDFVDESEVGRVAPIMTFVRLALDNVTRVSDGLADGSLRQSADELHEICNDFLGDVLVGSLAARIGLKSA